MTFAIVAFALIAWLFVIVYAAAWLVALSLDTQWFQRLCVWLRVWFSPKDYNADAEALR